MCPKIKFVYSLPYDRMLTEYAGKNFNEKQKKEVIGYIKKFQNEWNKINNLICRELENLTGNKWQKKKIECYIVKNCKYSGISDPLTIRMEKDFDYAFAVLIHELSHILVGYDLAKYEKVEKKIKKMFPKEKDPRIIRHIYINFLEITALKKIFSLKTVNKILKRSEELKIGKSYKIALKNGVFLEFLLKEK